MFISLVDLYCNRILFDTNIALNHHFESQCIPTPVSYFAHHLPPWLLQLMVVGTFYIEIIVPFAFFAPFKLLRRYAFWLQVGLNFFFSLVIQQSSGENVKRTLFYCLGLVSSQHYCNRKLHFLQSSDHSLVCQSFGS